MRRADRSVQLLVGVWLGLVALTCVSWWLGREHTGDAAVVGVLVITFAKIWAVGREFMELRRAPTVLRSIFDGWVVVVTVVLAVLYLAG